MLSNENLAMKTYIAIQQSLVDALKMSADSFSTIGDRIRYARQRVGISQAELAERIGVRQPSMWSYEKNKFTPRAEVLSKLSKELKVSYNWLLNGTDEKQIEISTKDENRYFKLWLINNAPPDLDGREQEILANIDFSEKHPGPEIYTIILTMMRMAHPLSEITSRITNIKAS